MLAVYFDEFAPDGAQSLRAYGLIVDEGARAAIGRLHAAQNKFIRRIEAEFARRKMRRMIGGKLEDGGDLPLIFAGSHQRRVATRAKRQHESVKQDGFARARFAGQRRQAARAFKIEPVDQHNVANGEADKHDRALHQTKMIDGSEYDRHARPATRGGRTISFGVMIAPAASLSYVKKRDELRSRAGSCRVWKSMSSVYSCGSNPPPFSSS